MSSVVVLGIQARDLEVQIMEAFKLECPVSIWECSFDEEMCNIMLVADIDDDDLHKLPVDGVMDLLEVDELIQ